MQASKFKALRWTKPFWCYYNITVAKNGHVSLKAVAEAAGVSAMTVSRVFRHSPKVSTATRDRVLEAAAQLGYRPDPLVAQLMERIRMHRQHGERATLALLYEHVSEPIGIHHYVTLESVRARAEPHGYRVDAIRVGKGGLSPKRVQQVLEARGIRGVLLSVSSPEPVCARLDFSTLAAATFGFGLTTPSLHRASANITQGLLEVFSRLEPRAYKRIGLAITPWVDRRSGHTYSGALLHYQQSLPKSRRLPLLLLDQTSMDKNRTRFCAWMNKHRPDALISLHEPVSSWLGELGLRMPEDVLLVVHDWQPTMTGIAGLDHRREEVAAAAVDLVATQLQHNEYGVPTVPRQILIPPSIRGLDM